MNIDTIEIDLIPVESSNVSGIGFNPESEILAIEMNDGHLYYYLDVPIKHYNGLLQCSKNIPGTITSIGSYLHRNIKGHYRYIQMR
jgi:hypothetical protein